MNGEKEKYEFVLALSGGMDSATVMGILIDSGRCSKLHCCLFDYGSKHSKYELESARKVISYYKEKGTVEIATYEIDLKPAFSAFKSDLLASSSNSIPEGEYNEDNMAATVVPGRNLIFASIMAGLAESVGAQRIALGVHTGDICAYADTTEEFLNSLDYTIRISSSDKVSAYAPLWRYNKAQVVQVGLNLKIPVPYYLTRSCYTDRPKSCGKCGTCTERLQAFKMNGITDSIEYEE